MGGDWSPVSPGVPKQIGLRFRSTPVVCSATGSGPHLLTDGVPSEGPPTAGVALPFRLSGSLSVKMRNNWLKRNK